VQSRNTLIPALALGTFAIGASETAVVGLLPQISAALGVPVSTVGFIVAAYALGVAIGAPLGSVSLSRVHLKGTLCASMACYAAAHVMMALAPSFWVLAVARLLAAACDGTFSGAAAVAAVRSSIAGRRTRALATTFTGINMAMALGLPLSAALGQHTSWRLPFVLIAVLSCVCVSTLLFSAVPDVAEQHRAAALQRRRAPQHAMLVSFLGWGGLYICLTFITDFLHSVTGVGDNGVSALLIAFGVGAVIGAPLAARAQDRWPNWTPPSVLLAQAVVLCGLAAFGRSVEAVAVLIVLWGGVGLGLLPVMQSRVLGSSDGENRLVSALNISAFNLGVAAAAAFSAGAVRAGYLAATPALAAVVVLIGAALASYNARRRWA
jgi:DHA1 family inner membrane transport protein